MCSLASLSWESNDNYCYTLANLETSIYLRMMAHHRKFICSDHTCVLTYDIECGKLAPNKQLNLFSACNWFLYQLSDILRTPNLLDWALTPVFVILLTFRVNNKVLVKLVLWVMDGVLQENATRIRLEVSVG